MQYVLKQDTKLIQQVVQANSNQKFITSPAIPNLTPAGKQMLRTETPAAKRLGLSGSWMANNKISTVQQPENTEKYRRTGNEFYQYCQAAALLKKANVPEQIKIETAALDNFNLL